MTEISGFSNRVFVPFDRLVGVTDDGVPVMSNGKEANNSSPQLSISLCYQPLCKLEETAWSSIDLPFRTLGVKWHAVEFVRRYLASRKGVWMENVTTSASIFDTATFTHIADKSPVCFNRVSNGCSTLLPDVGDVVVWRSSSSQPDGHAGVVVQRLEGSIHIAEQNNGCHSWKHGKHYNQELALKLQDDGNYQIIGDNILGWVRVSAPLLITKETDLGDDYRVLTGRGRIIRQSVEPDATLPWTNANASENSSEYYLRRSLIDGTQGKAHLTDVPSGFYHLDYNMWSRIRHGAHSLHQLALKATEAVFQEPDAAGVLENYFGIPSELHECLRRSWRTTPAFTGRFDFGTNGQTIKMLEYNCDSSGALLECCETQEKMAAHYGVNVGDSTGAILKHKILDFLKSLWNDKTLCPSHKLIHFVIDDDNEEKYTARCMIQFAEAIGFRTKLSTSVSKFHFSETELNLSPRCRKVLDEDGELLEVVWKTWSWDTVLHQFILEKEARKESTTPTLSDILLNDHIIVFEPLWKAVMGSKAILPYMYNLAPDHELLLPSSFSLTKELSSKPYISKPVNGRAGQNICMFERENSTAEDEKSNRKTLSRPHSTIIEDKVVDDNTEEGGAISKNASTAGSFAFSNANSFLEIDKEMENSPGRFYNSVVVYQQRHFLRKFSNYFPIFCGWMIGEKFSGVVVREDTSKITRLDSLVAPARVIRSDAVFHQLEGKYPEES